MTTHTKLKLIILAAFLFAVTVPGHAQAGEYKWLKTPRYATIFVYTDFKECDFMSYKLNETIKRTLSLYNIKPTISDSLVFQETDKKGKSTKELIDDDLIDAHKIILYIYGKCIDFNSAYIYQFDIHFAVIDKKYSQALLYSTPRHSAIGIDTIIGINKAFGRLMDDAVSDYLSANKAESK